ncbi:MAG: DDE-type integrase/transposase/recombinase [Clostridia bacterium]|nr:DDE-type integrase/transposase/recombinase [Clostridia bacterium]
MSSDNWLIMALFSGSLTAELVSERMTKDLVINVLKSAYLRADKPTGVLLHSDIGSQYCSYDYQSLIKKYGFVGSMSRKGNCCDSAPMEAF